MGTHHTLINGTSYAIKGGTDLIAGTSYQIGGGRTLVDGTKYEIGFSKPIQVQVTTTNKSKNNWGRIYINGAEVFEGSFELEQGTIIVLEAGAGGYFAGTISIDGEVVASKKEGTVQYDYEVTVDCNITLNRSNNDWGSMGNIVVTTK